MSQKLSVRKNTEHPTDALWWKPVFAMQKEMNNSLSNMITGFIPPRFWEAEREAFSMWQESLHILFSKMFNTRQMITPWLTGGRTEPYIDIQCNDNGFIIRADVPGINAENLDIALADSAITITGYKDSECEEGEGFLHHECCDGSFCRTIALPQNADTDKANVSFENSVLTIKVPQKNQGPKTTRKLEILVDNEKEQKSLSEKKAA